MLHKLTGLSEGQRKMMESCKSASTEYIVACLQMHELGRSR